MKKLTTSILLFLLVTTLCFGQNNQTSTLNRLEKSTITDSKFVPTDSTQLYFSSSYVDSFKNKWYSKHLFALREPIIFTDKSSCEIYRFTWLRTFHNPVAIRIEKLDSIYSLTWKLSSGAGGYEPGKIVINKHKTIDKQTWETFINKLNEINFWSLPTNENENLGLDGSQWILEGKTPKHYTVVDRWTPNKNSKYYDCCNFLIELTDLKIIGRDKY
jgi:hypothetical protein